MKRSLVLACAVLMAGCSNNAPAALQGYGEADYLYLASQEAGVVSEVFVAEGDRVEAGAPVFRLEPNRLARSAEGAAASRSALSEAVRAARADADLAQRTLARGEELFAQGYYPRARLDADRAARDAARARVAQAERELRAAGAETDLMRERIDDLSGAAPRAGVIQRVYHRPGEVVSAGAPIAALLAPENMKVRFFAPQNMLARLPVGATVNIACDGCAAGLTARVSFVATEPQYTPPVIYSLEQRDKLVYLIEARPSDPAAIRPGQPVDVTAPAAP